MLIHTSQLRGSHSSLADRLEGSMGPGCAEESQQGLKASAPSGQTTTPACAALREMTWCQSHSMT